MFRKAEIQEKSGNLVKRQVILAVILSLTAGALSGYFVEGFFLVNCLPKPLTGGFAVAAYPVSILVTLAWACSPLILSTQSLFHYYASQLNQMFSVLAGRVKGLSDRIEGNLISARGRKTAGSGK